MKTINFLIVEDNQLDYRLLKAIITKYYGNEAEIERVTSLGAAISEVTRDDRRYDIVLLDLNVDDSKGIATLQTFSKSCPVPIIICSALSDKRVIEQSVLHGAGGYIVKGESAEVIIDNINHALVNNRYLMQRRFIKG